jgi:hypothetical protein
MILSIGVSFADVLETYSDDEILVKKLESFQPLMKERNYIIDNEPLRFSDSQSPSNDQESTDDQGPPDSSDEEDYSGPPDDRGPTDSINNQGPPGLPDNQGPLEAPWDKGPSIPPGE